MLGGTKKNLEALNKLLFKTEINMVLKNQDGSISEVEPIIVGYKLSRKNYPTSQQGWLDADYELKIHLERK